ncbi:hypothetical protein VTO73DRAFT_4509 [Trametes versicolor]
MPRANTYTFLYVSEPCDGPTPPGAAVARYRLLMCPSRPLEIGSVVFLNHTLNAPWTVPFFPNATPFPLAAVYSDTWGEVVGLNKVDHGEVEFVVENWNIYAQVKRALVRVPRCPGLSVARNLWASFTDSLLLRIEKASGQAATRAEALPGRAHATSPEPFTPEIADWEEGPEEPESNGQEESVQWQDTYYMWVPNEDADLPGGSLARVSPLYNL